MQNLDEGDVENANLVRSLLPQKEMNVSTTAIYSELLHLQSKLTFISKHITSVTKQDVVDLFADVKTRVSERDTYEG